MENIEKFQEHICEYFDKQLAKFYSFDVWKKTVHLLLAMPKNPEAHKIYDRYGEAFKLTSVIVDVQASSDKWDPCLNLNYIWTVLHTKIPIRIMVVKGSVSFVQVLSTMEVLNHFGETFDFVKEFGKVELIGVLKTQANSTA
jgi:hypothetical protein